MPSLTKRRGTSALSTKSFHLKVPNSKDCLGCSLCPLRVCTTSLSVNRCRPWGTVLSRSVLYQCAVLFQNTCTCVRIVAPWDVRRALLSLGQPDGIAQCFGPRKGGHAGVVTSRFRETICSPRPWGQLLSAQNIYRRAGRRAADRHHEQTQPVNCMQHSCGMLTQCSDHTLSGSTLFFTVP